VSSRRFCLLGCFFVFALFLEADELTARPLT
jgi:hypothetical protein